MKKAKWVKTQKRKSIEVNCYQCNARFEKALTEYNRTEKQGRKHFCSLNCSSTHGMRIRDRTTIKYYDISQHAGSRWDECSPFRYMMNIAKRRKHEFDLSCEYLIDLWNAQNGRCAYTGIELKLRHNGNHKEDLEFHQASLDRIDSSKGYIEGNVQFVCVPINYAKADRDSNYVYRFLEAIRDSSKNGE